MSIPIVCLDARLRQFCETFRKCLSQPQYQYLVTVLLALMLCQETHTLSGLLRQVADGQSVSGLSRFMSRSPWSAAEVAGAWIDRFQEQLAEAVEAEHKRQRRQRPKRKGRPQKTVVTGYLIGDDSTQHKPKGKKMGGLGKHHSTSHEQCVTGHSLMQCLYVLLGRRCPLAPQMYRQKAVCEREGVPFQSKIDMMETTIREFEAVHDTQTHVLVDSWFGCKRIWRAARERGFLITSGLKCNRSQRSSVRPGIRQPLSSCRALSHYDGVDDGDRFGNTIFTLYLLAQNGRFLTYGCIGYGRMNGICQGFDR